MRTIQAVLTLAIIAVIVYLFLNAPQTNQVINSLGQQTSNFFRTLQGRG